MSWSHVGEGLRKPSNRKHVYKEKKKNACPGFLQGNEATGNRPFAGNHSQFLYSFKALFHLAYSKQVTLCIYRSSVCHIFWISNQAASVSQHSGRINIMPNKRETLVEYDVRRKTTENESSFFIQPKGRMWNKTFTQSPNYYIMLSGYHYLQSLNWPHVDY